MKRRVFAALSGFLVLMMAGVGQAQEKAKVTLQDRSGNQVGSAELVQTATGAVLLKGELQGMKSGVHAIHIHETGKCEPDFKAAGGHFAPAGNKHGAMVEGGRHAGDLPNITVSKSGSLKFEMLIQAISLKEGQDGYLFDNDGSALVIHSGADDYKSQPSGDAGERIACGTIENQ